MTINIRPATVADAPDIAEIHIRSWEAAYKDIIPADYMQEKFAIRPARWLQTLAEESDTHYVIQAEGNAAGFLTIAPHKDDDLDDTFYELWGLYLHPQYFRRGLGTKAMDFAINKARELGKKTLTVWVFADNINSIKFYEKCGFTADGKTDIIEYGKPLKGIRMRRPL